MRIHKKYLIIVEIFLITALCVGHYAMLGALNYGFAFLIALLMMFSSCEMNLIMLFLAVPFFNLFTNEIGNTSLFYVYIIIFIFKYLKEYGYKISRNKFICILGGFLLSLCWQDILLTVKWNIIFFFVVLLYDSKLLLNNLKSIIIAISCSALYASCYAYLLQLNNKSIYIRSYVYSKELGSTTRFAGLVGDSVFYTQFMVLIAAALLVIAFYNIRLRKFAYIMCVPYFFFILQSYSKTGIILSVVVVLIYCFEYFKTNIKRKRTLYKAGLIIAIVIISFIGIMFYIKNNMDNVIVTNFITRFSSKDLWTGRNSVSEAYIKLLTSDARYFFVGMPYEVYSSGIINVGAIKIIRAHNIYIETACLFGIIPAIAIILWLISKIIRFIVFNKKNLICMLPVLIMILSGFTIHGHYEWHYYFCFLLSISFISQRFYKKE